MCRYATEPSQGFVADEVCCNNTITNPFTSENEGVGSLTLYMGEGISGQAAVVACGQSDVAAVAPLQHPSCCHTAVLAATGTNRITSAWKCKLANLLLGRSRNNAAKLADVRVEAGVRVSLGSRRDCHAASCRLAGLCRRPVRRVCKRTSSRRRGGEWCGPAKPGWCPRIPCGNRCCLCPSRHSPFLTVSPPAGIVYIQKYHFVSRNLSPCSNRRGQARGCSPAVTGRRQRLTRAPGWARGAACVCIMTFVTMARSGGSWTPM